jgi:hypothetical protein
MSGRAVSRRISNLLDVPAGSLDDHRMVFHALIDLAVAGRVSDRDRLFITQLAAHYAWSSHPGEFASPALELVGRAAGPGHGRGLHNADRGRVLHVLTEGYATGGHTRLAERWIEADARREHSVALTAQSLEQAPASMVRAARRSGGTAHDLSRIAGDLHGRAAALRAIAADYGFVVLHVHPYDVVPLVALGPGSGSRVLFVNHADHVFWLGAGLAHALVCLRDSGARLAVARRGHDASRIAIVPVPVSQAPTPMADRDEARASLGIAGDDVLILTVASDYKFTPMGDLDYPRVAVDIIAAERRVHVHVIGPTNTARWASAVGECDGRLVVHAPTPHASRLLRAADIYLDSFPFASLTSMLEAGNAGLPLLTLRGHGAGAAVLAADGPGVDGVAIRVSTPGDLVAAVVDLARDALARHDLGQRTAQAIAEANRGPAWEAAVERAYAVAEATAADVGMSPVPDVPQVGELDTSLVRLHRGIDGLARPLSAQLSNAGPATRASIGLAALRQGHPVRPWALLPSSIRLRLRSLR